MADNRGSKPGEKRGGRQKGTPNKKTLAVAQKLEALACDPSEGRWPEPLWMKPSRWRYVQVPTGSWLNTSRQSAKRWSIRERWLQTSALQKRSVLLQPVEQAIFSARVGRLALTADETTPGNCNRDSLGFHLTSFFRGERILPCRSSDHFLQFSLFSAH
jgi:hypothetical protein